MSKRKKIILVSSLVSILVIGIAVITILSVGGGGGGGGVDSAPEKLIVPAEPQTVFDKVEDKNSDGEVDVLDMIMTVKDGEWNDLQ